MPKTMMIDPVRKLIVDALAQHGLTKKSASKMIGKNESYLQQFIERRVPRKLPEDTRDALASLLKIPSEVLKTGKVEDYSRDDSEVSTFEHVAIDHLSRERQISVAVPELDVRAAMGGGALVDSENLIGMWEIPADLLRAQTSGPLNALKIIMARGDSNVPDILPNARLIVDTSDTQPSPPGYFALWDGIGLVVKRVEFLLNSDPPSIRITSGNPAYKEYQRAIDEVKIAGRVKGLWTWM